MKNKSLILFLFFSVLLTGLNAQSISGVKWQQIPGENKIEVLYSINGGKIDKEFNVSLFYSEDAGESFYKAKSVEGDIGKGVKSGSTKRIIWDVFMDESKLDGDIVFKVAADVIKLPFTRRTFVGYHGTNLAPVGLTFMRLGKTGFYARASSSFNAFTGNQYTYSGLTNNMIGLSGDYYYNTISENLNISRANASLGLTFQLGHVGHLSLGAGYASHRALFEIEQIKYGDVPIDENKTNYWAKYDEISASGPMIELGYILELKRLSLHFGVSNMFSSYNGLSTSESISELAYTEVFGGLSIKL
ncbi:MAG: hypothetical protein JXQ87_11310 [Bacteroidia bacterium]